MELKCHAKHACAKLWSFHQADSEAEAAALRRVAVLLVTADAALKILGRAATPGSPAAKLMKGKPSSALLLDEMQRCPIEAFCASGRRHDAVVAVGGRGQEVHPAAPSGRSAAALPNADLCPAGASDVRCRVIVGTGIGCACRAGRPDSLPHD